MAEIRSLKFGGLLTAALFAVSPLSPVLAQSERSTRPPVVAKVEVVQFPVWIERGGVKAGVKAGWAVYAGDRVITGANGRVALAVVGDGQLKLGGDSIATFATVDLSNAVTEGKEPSLLRIDQGAFHFTAPAISRGERGTGIEVGSGITANVLGGQVVGKSDSGLDQIGLIEGNVEVSGSKMTPGRMSKPETMMAIPRKGRAQPVSPMPREKMAQWLSQTGPVSGRPSLVADGVWDVSLGSGYNQKELETLACRIQSRGYPAEMYPVREPGKQVWYRVVVRRFASKQDASGFIRTAQGMGSQTAWVLLPQT